MRLHFCCCPFMRREQRVIFCEDFLGSRFLLIETGTALLFCIFVLDLRAQDPVTYRGYRFALYNVLLGLFFSLLRSLSTNNSFPCLQSSALIHEGGEGVAVAGCALLRYKTGFCGSHYTGLGSFMTSVVVWSCSLLRLIRSS
jgi:hypothetical protein